MCYSQCMWQEGMSVSSHQMGFYRWKAASKLDFFCWFVLGAWIQSVTVGVHLQILIIHTEMHEFTATSFVKEVFIPHKCVQEQEWLDLKCLSTETKKAQSRPAQHPFSPRALTVRQKFLNYYQCRICAMAKLLCFPSKCFTIPQHASA